MRKEQDREPSDAARRTEVPRQSDLAEGERKTVEESIRIHEQKGDLPKEPPDGGARDKS